MKASANFSLIWLVTLILAASSSSFGSVAPQLHPNLARGTSREKSVDQTDWDKVNLFNGNLQITLPVGGKYPLAKDFDYQITLNYNSNVWSWRQTSATVITAVPNEQSNAGFGWDLSLGRLIDPFAANNELRQWVYVSPDGSARPFFNDLHADKPEPADNVYYTRDSSYYRLNQVSATQTIVELPDGTIQTFELNNNEWRLVKIANRYSAYLSISYLTANAWTLTDNHGRTHTIYFKADPAGHYPAVVDRVVVASFGSAQATYTFEYTVASVLVPTTDNDPATPTSISLPQLTGITAPDGSKHSFVYHWRVPGAGRLASMQLPTLGKVEWSYQNYSFTTAGCPSALGSIYKNNVGVSGRWIIDASGNYANNFWTFTPRLNPLKTTVNGQEVCQEEREMSNTVQNPVGDKTTHYFSVNTTGGTGGWTKTDYALPGTKNEYDTSGTRILAKRISDCDAGGLNCQVFQSGFVRYEQDAGPDPASPLVGVSTNRRQASDRTTYHNDLENGVMRFADIDRSEFDGLGHYRRTVTNGNFGKGDAREHYLNFNAATGNYPSPGYTSPAPTARWLINTFNRQKTTEGNASQTIEFCHDNVTGFLSRVRRWRTTDPNGTASERDVIVRYTNTSLGDISKEQYYGGDVQSVATSALCSLAFPATDQYQIRHTYQYGVRNSSRFYDASGLAFGPKTLDLTVDKNTGLVKQVRDSAGLTTQYVYDSMGRRTWIKPATGHGAWKQYSYTVATGPGESGQRTTSNDFPNGGGSTALTAEQKIADSFGRPWLEKRFMPDNTWVSRYTLYNALGWQTDESEFSAAAPIYKKYLNHDPAGSARTVSPPDGAHHNISYEYAGIRSVKRTVPTATSYNKTTGQINEQPRSTTEVYDRQGRLWKEITHTIDQFGSPRDITVEHFYSVDGRRTGSYQDGGLMGSSYVYDGRGFLTTVFSEARGAETTTYLDLDALGRPQRSQLYNHPLNSITFLGYVYDRASRTTIVRDPNNTSKLWKEFTYADVNGTNDWRAGKLWKTKRYNDMTQHWSEVGVATVSETYTYGGKDGRLSRYDIEFSDQVGRLEKFYQTYAYDEMGNVTELGYPNNEGGNINIGRTRTVTNTYSRGYLSAVSGTYNGQSENWASAIIYHPFGLNKQVVHANGVTDNIAADPNGLARPSSVSTTGATDQFGGLANFNSGTFQFDGAGHLVKAGSEVFVKGEGDVPPPLPPPYPHLCSTGWRDPFGLTYASYDAPCSMVKVFYYYTASDRLFKIEDGVREEKVWYFPDHQGRPLTTYVMVHGHRLPWANTWQYTRDHIYRGNYTVAIDERRRDEPARTYHYHVGHGSRGMRTDLNGKRVE